MPPDPGAALEVVQAEAVFEFAVVVLDAPVELGQADRFGDPGVWPAGWTASSRWVLRLRQTVRPAP